MPGLNFQARFADAVERGEKRQTIRQVRKRPIVAGDTLKLMTGQRQKGQYRSLGEATCLSVEPIAIYTLEQTINLNGMRLARVLSTAIASRDGFAPSEDFFKWFHDRYGRLFRGVLIQW